MMNSLSWLIYAAGVVHSADLIIGSLVILIIPALTLMKLLGAFQNTDWKFVNAALTKVEIGEDKLPFSVRQLIAAWFVLAFIGIVTPSRSTVILIASSEYGEKILNNPKITEVVDPSIDLLKTWIEKEKKELIEDSKEKK
jgi:hypothetical protein